MNIAAEAGIAPRVLYTGIEDRVSLTDFLEARPLPAAEAAVRLAVTRQALQALSPFPRLVVHMFYAMAFMRFAGEPIELNETAPAFRNFHNRIWAGEVSLAADDAKVQRWVT
jgi:hypothetical protein